MAKRPIASSDIIKSSTMDLFAIIVDAQKADARIRAETGMGIDPWESQGLP